VAAEFGGKAYKATNELYENEKLDAVFLSVSPKLHPPLAMEAFQAGLHVWMEKPPATRASQISAMIQARGDLVAVVGFKKAFMPSTLKVKEILALPGSGPLKSLLAEYPMRVPDEGAKILAQETFTDWLGNGVHPLSWLREVGGPPAAVTTHRSRHGGGSVVIEFTSGAVGTLACADGASTSVPCERYSAFFKGGSVEISNNLRVTWRRGIPFDYGKTNNFAPAGFEHGSLVWEPQNTLGTPENVAFFTQGFVPEMQYFCDCVLDGRKPETGSLEFALDVMKMYEGALLSEGSKVNL
jgi:predicted dehydrogenase